MYEKLLSEGRINGCTIRNRVILSPMDDCLGQSSGEVTQRGIEYYANKAKGGCGLVIVGYVGFIGPEMGGVAMSGQTFLMNYDQRHAMSILAERVHEYGGKVFVQLNHPGRKTNRDFNQGHEPVSSSAMTPDLEKRGFVPCHELTVDEIQQIETACADAALHAFRAGVDGVEIHCAHYYLFNQFLSPSRNARTDEYGGSMENRCRIIVETIEKIRERVPDNYPITIRVHLLDGEGMDGDNSLEDMLEITQYLEKKGVDAFHFSIGTEQRTGTPEMKSGWRNEYYKKFKEVLSVPIYGPNEVKTPEEAEANLEAGAYDFVVMGRQLSADPEWVNKAMEGRSEDIRPCLSCNWCVNRVTADQAQIRCAVNPLLGREVDNLMPLKDGEGTVCVIGAGPAGVQAAMTLSKRGFKVKLYDELDKVGGTLNYANKPPHKDRIENLRHWFELQAEKDENIEVHLNTKVDEKMLDELEAMNPYAVILACGGTPIAPGRLPGIEKALVWKDVLSGSADIRNQNVAVIGGGMTGLETAQYLVERGNKVTIIEMLPLVGNGIYFYNVRNDLRHLKEKGTVIKVNTQMLEVKDDAVVVKPTKVKYTGTSLAGIKNIAGVADAESKDESTEPYEIPVDRTVVALGVRPQTELLAELKRRFKKVVNIGDCNKQGNIGNATYEGYLTAKNI